MTEPALHRVIRIAASGDEVRVALEDDFHHFRLAVRHDGVRIAGVATESLRAPYTLCPAAGRELDVLVGTQVTTSMAAVLRGTDAFQQCTHQLDMAALAITAAARGTARRRYDVVVPDARPMVGTVRRDGTVVLTWSVEDNRVTAPSMFAGRSLGAGLTLWLAAHCDDETAEAGLVLRRGLFIARGRGRARMLDATEHAPPRAGCWVQQPERAFAAKRNVGSTLDWADRPDMLTADDAAWLDFAQRTGNAPARCR